MSRPSPDEALEQYLLDAKNKGISFKTLSTSRHFLRQLLGGLRGVSQDGAGYRAATEEIMRIMPEENRTAFLSAVREFFPYWNGEVTAKPAEERIAPSLPPVATPVYTISEPLIAALAPSESGGSTVGMALGAGLAHAIARMEQDPWAQQDIVTLERQLLQMRSLGRYTEELKRLGLSDSNVQLRSRLMKFLLYTIRDKSQNTEVYRLGVDKALTLLPKQDRWHIFVSLAREFFYFLAATPDAGSKVQMNISDEEMLALLEA